MSSNEERKQRQQQSEHGDIHEAVKMQEQEQQQPNVEQETIQSSSATPVVRLSDQQQQQNPNIDPSIPINMRQQTRQPTNIQQPSTNIAAQTFTTTTTVLTGDQQRDQNQGEYVSNVNYIQEPTVNFFNRFVAKDTHCLMGRTGVKISRITLGSMNFGEISGEFGKRPGQLKEEEAHAILDRFLELGGNCIDTADFFPWFGNDAGLTEKIIGNWLSKATEEKRCKRENVFLITKVRMPFDATNINSIGLSRKHLYDSVEASLKRLQTEYIDMLMLNGWDNSVSFTDTVQNLNDLIKVDKIRYIGVCDFKGWQLQKFIDTSKLLNLHKCVCYMGQYSLLERGCEWEVLEVCKKERIGFIAYSPLKYGFLTNESISQHNNVSVPSGTRIDNATNNLTAMAEPLGQIRRDTRSTNVLTYCQMLARKYRVSISKIAVQWLLQSGVVTSVCIGVQSVKQLDEIMSCLAGEFVLSREDMDELNYYSQVQLHYPYHTQVAQIAGFKVLSPIENQTQFEQLNLHLTSENLELEPEGRMQRLNLRETCHEGLNLDFPEREFMQHLQKREFPVNLQQKQHQLPTMRAFRGNAQEARQEPMFEESRQI